jgi:hypothetical protein
MFKSADPQPHCKRCTPWGSAMTLLRRSLLPIRNMRMVSRYTPNVIQYTRTSIRIVQPFLNRASSNQKHAKQHHMHISYTEFQPNRTTRVESTARNIFTPLKYSFHSRWFNKYLLTSSVRNVIQIGRKMYTIHFKIYNFKFHLHPEVQQGFH